MDIKAIENIETAKEITKIIDEAFSPSYLYYDVWGVIKGEWKEEIAVKDEAYSLLFQIQEINRQLHGDNITISEHVPNLHERSDLITKRSDLAVKVKSLLEGKIQQNNDNKQPQQEQIEQQQKEHKSIKGKGRPPKKLKDRMINDADGSKLQKIHKVMDGKTGRDAALIILACIKMGWMLKPTFPEVKKEFGNIGSRQGFNKYLKGKQDINEKQFTEDEMEGAMNSLMSA